METGIVSVLRWGRQTTILLAPLERANFIQSINPVIEVFSF
jgi:hypothetical protein